MAIYNPPNTGTTASGSGAGYTKAEADARFVHKIHVDEIVLGEKTFADKTIIGDNLNFTNGLETSVDELLTIDISGNLVSTGLTIADISGGAADIPALDARFVNITGDTMTGELIVPQLIVNDGLIDNPALDIYAGETGGDLIVGVNANDNDVFHVFTDFADNGELYVGGDDGSLYLRASSLGVQVGSLTASPPGNFLTYDSNGYLIDSGVSAADVSGGVSGAQTFLELDDTPSSYPGNGYTPVSSGNSLVFIAQLSGRYPLDTINKKYIIMDPRISMASIPVANVLSPEDEELIVHNIVEVGTGYFKLELSAVPAISGYEVLWICMGESL